jgi:hypothetical protein
MKNPELRFSIWDQNDTVLFDSYDYDEIIEQVGKFEAPLYSVGDKIKVNNKLRTIERMHLGISEGIAKIQIVVCVEGVG